MAKITLVPLATVSNERTKPEDDHWGNIPSVITLDEALEDSAFLGLEGFSHIEVVFFFHLVSPSKIRRTSRRPRNRTDWPETGIFAQRNKARPNRLGVSRCRLIKVEPRKLHVMGLDAIDGTPILDIKPWFTEFAPRGEVRQADWSHELMSHYYDEP